ncbi:hypothetical protein MXB_2734 [Myxobolus squamalis]|nr:hypothetical protein MXB_2734 [Myxobolus squamalis]
MNVPDPFDAVILLAGEKKATYKIDPRVSNYGVFTFKKEDHTIANVLQAQLLLSDEVKFAAYKIAHPFDHEFTLRVQTTSNTTPVEAMLKAVRVLMRDVDIITEQFEVKTFNPTN